MDDFRREKRNKRRKRGMMFGGALTAVILLFAVIIGYAMREDKVKEYRAQLEKDNKTHQTAQKEDAPKTSDQTNTSDQKTTDNTTKNTDATGNANGEDQSTKNGDELTGQPTALVKNSNHIESASSYAYDVSEITKYIRPKKDPSHVDYTKGKKICFLTFDDGPNDVITPKILDVLKEKGVHATFFCPGKNINEKTKPILERELKEGNAVAIHSYSHDYGFLYPGRVGNTENIVNECKKALQACKDVLGPDFNTHVWRYPGGHMSWKSLEGADKGMEDLGVHWIDWNCLCGDAEPKSHRPTTVDEMVKYTFDSNKYFYEQELIVVLCHDAPDKHLTAEALPKIIDGFKERGYEFGILK